MTSISFIRTINQLQTALLTKKTIIFCNKTKVSTKICCFLLAQGLIHFYVFNIIKKKYEIKLKTFQNTHLIKNFTLISKPGLKVYLTVYKLKTLLWKTKNYYYLLRSSSNFSTKFTNVFVTQREALQLNAGGELLVKIEVV